ncbi:Methylated-DNA--protein-cysteine methyltransferase [Escovopsis weberi]|uniref:Methylated-DNA--protein-cysteine methyltransferase n=1 Tax=Escovopsis weberi TaxID=150374 RepID=A0A0M8MZB9_ESCWE|nr:Methylated-DNA--protein-cysteine methyltransferase [Escovopsis weberi]
MAPADKESLLLLISQSPKTPFQKRVLSLLLQIPPGRVTSYALLSAHLGSSPRAVGNALRRNPFAPGVPCHRVIATGGGLGGFKGEWPRGKGKGKGKVGAAAVEGITIAEKRRLLRGEGVRFDGGGRVLGTPFSGFVG